jgi:hypothetical protein
VNLTPEAEGDLRIEPAVGATEIARARRDAQERLDGSIGVERSADDVIDWRRRVHCRTGSGYAFGRRDAMC